jgi:predicted O-methyltransferase YrrM
MDAAAPTDQGFEAAWAVGSTISGWLTPAQARLLYERGVRVPAGATVLEIGSHQGRSTVVLAHAARRAGGRVVAVDPFVDGPMFGGAATRDRFTENVRRGGVADAVRLLPEYSTALRPNWAEPLGLLYVDGKHDYWTAADDLRWAAFLPDGGDVLVHDAFSSVGVTLALLPRLLGRSRLV